MPAFDLSDLEKSFYFIQILISGCDFDGEWIKLNAIKIGLI